jgi:hypothetical protein
MDHPAIQILNTNGLMAISTVRPDGWPQTTVVGYANRGFELLFMIFRSSQKFANIQHDDRISIAVAPEPPSMNELKAVYAGAHASEITDPAEQKEAWRQLMQRHSNLSGFYMPEGGEVAYMRARCKFVSVLDNSQGAGHREQFVVNDDGSRTEIAAGKDAEGDGASSSPAG